MNNITIVNELINMKNELIIRAKKVIELNLQEEFINHINDILKDDNKNIIFYGVTILAALRIIEELENETPLDIVYKNIDVQQENIPKYLGIKLTPYQNPLTVALVKKFHKKGILFEEYRDNYLKISSNTSISNKNKDTNINYTEDQRLIELNNMKDELKNRGFLVVKEEQIEKWNEKIDREINFDQYTKNNFIIIFGALLCMESLSGGKSIKSTYQLIDVQTAKEPLKIETEYLHPWHNHFITNSIQEFHDKGEEFANYRDNYVLMYKYSKNKKRRY